VSGPLYLVADDLTGALDSACAFAQPGAPVAVSWASAAPGTTASLAFSTETRDVSGTTAQQCAAAAAEAARSAPAGTLLFKKLDSLLRGHPALELAAFAEVVRPDRIVLAPAHPSLGRITRGGWQHMRLPDGSFERISVDLAAGLAACGIGSDLLLADAETDAELEALVVRECAEGGRILWCGSGGLAQALAGGRCSFLPVPTGAVLAVVGTDHAVTAGQVEALRERDPAAVICWQDGDEPADIARKLNARLDRTGVTVLKPGIAPCGRQEAARRIAAMLTPLMGLLHRPGALFCSGGETLRVVCDALGAEALFCEGLVADGVPLSQIRTERWPMLPVMSKSGAFGSRQTLLDLLMPVPERVLS